MRQYSFALLTIFAAVLVIFPSQLLACACCAEPGTYFLRTAKPDTYSLSVIRQISFEKQADLYMTEAGFDMVRGLDAIKKEYEADTWTILDHFDLASTYTTKLWRFELKTPGGTAGSLTLPLPNQMVTYKVDIHDDEDRPNGPLLYKEFRFKGGISSATGFLRPASTRGTTYFLVYQGRGNGCDNPSDFTHWRLEIEGPRSSYAFFGKLDIDAARERELAEGQ